MAVLMQDGLAIHAIEIQSGLAPTRVEGRFHGRETVCHKGWLLVHTDIGRYSAVAAVVVLRVPSVVAILVEERLAFQAPVSLARYLATSVEIIDDPVDAVFSIQ